MGKHSESLRDLRLRLSAYLDEAEAHTLAQAEQTAQRLEAGEGFSVVPVVSVRDGSPRVDASWMGMLAQLAPDQAREIAQALMNCAAQAETDAVAMILFRDEMGLDEEVARTLRFKLRVLRDELLRREPVKAMIQEPSADEVAALGKKNTH